MGIAAAGRARQLQQEHGLAPGDELSAAGSTPPACAAAVVNGSSLKYGRMDKAGPLGLETWCACSARAGGVSAWSACVLQRGEGRLSLSRPCHAHDVLACRGLQARQLYAAAAAGIRRLARVAGGRTLQQPPL